MTRNSSDDDVLEGSNVTLVCRAYSFSTPPKWAYYRMINGSKEELVFINETISPQLGKNINFNEKDEKRAEFVI